MPVPKAPARRVNTPVEGHPLVGQSLIYRADMPPYSHRESPSVVVVIAPGMSATVLSVFHDWNGVRGLTMCYVEVPVTGLHTHLVPGDLSFPDKRVATECKWCGRTVEFDPECGKWVDPEASGDDSIWRESCERHDTFTAEHEVTNG